MFLNVRAA